LKQRLSILHQNTRRIILLLWHTVLDKFVLDTTTYASTVDCACNPPNCHQHCDRTYCARTYCDQPYLEQPHRAPTYGFYIYCTWSNRAQSYHTKIYCDRTYCAQTYGDTNYCSPISSMSNPQDSDDWTDKDPIEPDWSILEPIQQWPCTSFSRITVTHPTLRKSNSSFITT
jgi:hypothetical protein